MPGTLRTQFGIDSSRIWAVAAALGLCALAGESAAQDCGRGQFNGLSIGVDAGLARQNSSAGYSAPLANFPTSSGFSTDHSVFGSAVGGRVGYNLQCQSMVFGFEADASATRLELNQLYYNPFGTAGFRDNQFTADSELDWFGTLRGRLGWLITPSLLVYGTGGAAYGHVKHSISWTYQGLGTVGVTSTAAVEDTKWGWALGGGLEYAIGNWSLRGEALHVDLGSTSTTFRIPTVFGPAATTQSARWDDQFWVARVGLTYRLLP